MTKAVQTRQTLDQQRATFALSCIRTLDQRHRDEKLDYGHYVSYVSGLPAMIVMNGLGQALTTLLASAGRKQDPRNAPHYLLYSHVAKWLSRGEDKNGVLPGPPDEFIDRLMKSDQTVYLRAQMEAMAYLNWLKQFARAYLKEKDGQDG